MKDFKLEVVKYLTDDVVATSGLCKMSGDSYFLFFDCCTETKWELTIIPEDKNNPNYTGDVSTFSYYNENGILSSEDFKNSNWPTGIDAPYGNAKWFHYSGGNFYLCDNASHHHQYGTLG